MQRAAFFDIDKTLYPGTLAVDFVNQIKTDKKPRALLQELSLGEDADVVEILKAIQASGKMSQQLYLSLIQETFKKARGKFNRSTLQLFKELRRQGFCMVALSQAPFMLLKLYAQNIGGDSFDVVASPMPTFVQSPEGIFLGPRSVIPTHERAKDAWVRHLADCYGFDLALSLAIGDSTSDIPMLEAVGGRKIAFNPDKILRAKAETEGWEIMEDIKLNQKEK